LLTADGAGLQPNGSNLRIDFGRAEVGNVVAVSRLVGVVPVERVTRGDCGAGPISAVRWANGLTLNFQRDAFVGWTLAKGRGAPIQTSSGLAPGQPREALSEAQFRQTSLGLEFTAGGVSGHLNGDEVDLIWAGTTCFFR
jgi:hypothetical protein